MSIENEETSDKEDDLILANKTTPDGTEKQSASDPDLCRSKSQHLEAQEEKENAVLESDHMDLSDHIKLNALKADIVVEDIVQELVNEALIEGLEIREEVSGLRHVPIDRSGSSEPDNNGQLGPGGFPTNIIMINYYLTFLVKHLLEYFASNLIIKFNRGLQISHRDVIRIIRENEIEFYEEGGLKSSSTPLREVAELTGLFLHSEIFDTFEEVFNEREAIEQDLSTPSQPDKQQTVGRCRSHFHRALFDGFNEVLTNQWTRDNTINYYNLISNLERPIPRILGSMQDLERLLLFAKDVVCENSSFYCGVLSDKEEAEGQENQLTMETFWLRQIREERLVKMLAEEVR